MEPIYSFGYWLRRRRKALDLTQQELARRVSCSVVMIKKIEADERRPSPLMADRLAEELEIAPNDRSIFRRVACGELSTTWLSTFLLQGAAARPPLYDQSSSDTLIPTSPLIGRDTAIRIICDWLCKANRRLVTLAGPPGIGKTRLGLHVAAALRGHFVDGVRLVELAPVHSEDHVRTAIAGAVGVREVGRQSLRDRLQLALRDQHMLLLLDNYEHVIGSAPVLAELLSSCSQLSILVTSREVLRLRDEHVFRVPPLDVPPQHSDVSQTQLTLNSFTSSPAIALFIERARAVQPDFQLTLANAPALADVCRRLDGLPLALELAAAWTPVLDPPGLLAWMAIHQVGSTLPALAQGVRDMPERHQTLRQAIAWSYDLLRNREQALFRALAVFAGGWSLEAATAVVSGQSSASPAHPAAAILADLDSLVAKSMIQRAGEFPGEVRLGMLETMRAYAWERLEAHNEAQAVQQRHALYYLELAAQANAAIHSPEQRYWLDRLEIDQANFRLALSWFAEQSESNLMLQLAASLGTFWLMRGYLAEGRQWLTGALAQGSNLRTAVRARAALRLGDICYHQYDLEAARTNYELSRAIFQELDDPGGVAWALYGISQLHSDSKLAHIAVTENLAQFRAVNDRVGSAAALNSLGTIARWQGDYDTAQKYHTESLELSQSIGDLSGSAWAHALLGKVLANRGNYSAACEHYKMSLNQFQAAANNLRVAWAMQGLGEAYLWQTDLDLAAATFEDCLARFRRLGDQNGIAWAHYNLGRVALERREIELADSQLHESLLGFRAAGDQHDSAWALTVLGQVAQRQDRLAQAWSYYQQGLVIHQRAGSQLGIIQVVEGCAALLARNNPLRAVDLWAAAAATRAALGIPLPLSEQARYTHTLNEVRSQLGAMVFAQAWALAEQIPLDRAVHDILSNFPFD